MRGDEWFAGEAARWRRQVHTAWCVIFAGLGLVVTALVALAMQGVWG